MSTVIPARVSFKEDPGRYSKNIPHFFNLSTENLDSGLFQPGFCVA